MQSPSQTQIKPFGAAVIGDINSFEHNGQTLAILFCLILKVYFASNNLFDVSEAFPLPSPKASWGDVQVTFDYQFEHHFSQVTNEPFGYAHFSLGMAAPGPFMWSSNHYQPTFMPEQHDGSPSLQFNIGESYQDSAALSFNQVFDDNQDSAEESGSNQQDASTTGISSLENEVADQGTSPVAQFQSPASQQSAKPRLKVDYGMKLFIRYWRNGLILLFNARGYVKGIHHWDFNRWLKEAQHFANNEIGRDLKKSDLCGLVMLLYSAFGAVAKRKEAGSAMKDSDLEKLKVYNGLGKSKRKLLACYYTIFANNNKKMMDQFFNNSVIRAFWPATLPFITYNLCFGKSDGPNENLIPSFKEITRIIPQNPLENQQVQIYWVRHIQYGQIRKVYTEHKLIGSPSARDDEISSTVLFWGSLLSYICCQSVLQLTYRLGLFEIFQVQTDQSIIILLNRPPFKPDASLFGCAEIVCTSMLCQFLWWLCCCSYSILRILPQVYLLLQLIYYIQTLHAVYV